MFTNEKGDAILVCACNSTEHQMLLWRNEGEVYAEVHLVKLPLLKRLKYALKYILGHQSMYGAFDEFIFKPEHGNKLMSLGKYLKSEKKNKKRH